MTRKMGGKIYSVPFQTGFYGKRKLFCTLRTKLRTYNHSEAYDK